MADTEIAQRRTGWGGHIWTAVISAVMGSLAPYIFGAALTLQYRLNDLAEDPTSDDVLLAFMLGKGFRLALASLFWSGIILWFVGCTAQLRRRQMPWPVWPAWGAVTLAVSYVIGVILLFPKSDFGRHAILIPDPFSIETAIGIAGSAAMGAIAGAILYALTPKWPASALRPSGSN